jgi:integrase
VKEGQPTSEQDTIRQALRFVRRLYGSATARDFGPLALKAVRHEMVGHLITRKVKVRDETTGKVREETKVLRRGLTRRYINKQIGRIKRMFAWAVEEELVPATVHQALLCVKGLKKGKDDAREKPRIGPVPEAFVLKILPHLPFTVRAMVEIQRLCGCRPKDVVQMRAIDIDMNGTVWEYRPARYKTEHYNEDDDPDRERIVFLGPRAQVILRPFLTLSVSDYLFSPRRSEEQRNDDRRAKRKTPIWPSHARRRRTSKPGRAPLDRYTVASYRRAIQRACRKAGIPLWCPLQLRHSAGTAVRKRFGLEASQAVLGHQELGTTQVYAAVDRETAQRVMAEIG